MQQPIDIVNTPGRYSPHLLSLDFFKGFDFYSQLCMLIGFERAGVLVDRITEYCSPHIEQLNVFLAQISTSHEFNPKPEHGNDNYHTITEIIAKYYQYRLSGGRECTISEINARGNALFNNCFANLYPFMGSGDFQVVKSTFIDILSRSFDEKVENTGIVWDKCDLISVSLDSYVVSCYKQEGASALKAVA